MPDFSSLLNTGTEAASAAFPPLGIALQGANVLGQGVLGIVQFLNAIKQAKQNVRPTYTINPEYQQNIDLIKNTLGLPQSALDLYYNQVGQSTASGINAINANGGNANQIAGVLNNQAADFQKVLVMDAMQKKEDLGQLENANLALAEQKDKAFQINQFAPFEEKSQATTAEKNAGLTNIFGALGSLSGFGANYSTANLLKSTTPKPTSPPTTGVDYISIAKQLNAPTTITTDTSNQMSPFGTASNPLEQFYLNLLSGYGQ